jgi:hypothetical protein
MHRALVIAAFALGLAAEAHAQTTSGSSSEGTSVSRTEIRELIEAAQATAKASRENVDYARVVPDLLYQILAKLDKIEDKLDKVETKMKAEQASGQKKR